MNLALPRQANYITHHQGFSDLFSRSDAVGGWYGSSGWGFWCTSVASTTICNQSRNSQRPQVDDLTHHLTHHEMAKDVQQHPKPASALYLRWPSNSPSTAAPQNTFTRQLQLPGAGLAPVDRILAGSPPSVHNHHHAPYPPSKVPS